jgi:ribosome-associated protein
MTDAFLKTVVLAPGIVLDPSALQWEFVRSSGPGGQNVNKVATAVQLRFKVLDAPSLPEDVRSRLVQLAGRRINSEGFLVIHARRFRSQRKNREDAFERLIEWLEKAVRKPDIQHKRKTRPSMAARQRRLDQKKKRAEVKRRRGAPKIVD